MQRRLSNWLWPELKTLSGVSLVSFILDVSGLFYMLPFALSGLIWLTAVTELPLLSQNWPVGLALLPLILLLRRWEFSIWMEIRPGVFSRENGSLEAVITWSTALIFGPTALWLVVLTALASFIRRIWVDDRPWRHGRLLATEMGTDILGGLVGLQLYRWLGGGFPFLTGDGSDLGAGIMATLAWFLAARVVMLPIIWRTSNEPDLVGSGSLTSRSGLIRFWLLGMSLPGIAAPFALFAAGLYARLGWGFYFIFVVVVLLAGLLANRLSDIVARAEQRRRELAALERLSRATIDDPEDIEALREELQEPVQRMFGRARLEVRLFPDDVLFQHLPAAMPQVTPAVWEQLQAVEDDYLLREKVRMPGQKRQRPSMDELVAPIREVAGGEKVGGIYLLTEPQFERARNYLPAVQSLAAQIAAIRHRAAAYQQALQEQAEVYQAEIYAQAYQAEVYAQALAYQRMAQELSVAGQIQTSFLPKEAPDVAGWQLAVTLEPARETSGDFYDFIPLENGRLGILVADVADKGIGPALYMALSRTLIRTYAVEHSDSPARALAAAHRRILADTNSDLFVTAFYAVLDPESGRLTYCNAGHNPPLLLSARNGNRPQGLTRTALPLGILPEQEWFQETAEITPGDVLLMYTDGVVEAQDEDEAFFGEERLRQIITSYVDRSADVIEGKILTAVYDFMGDAALFDDLTLMVLKRNPRLPAADLTRPAE